MPKKSRPSTKSCRASRKSAAEVLEDQVIDNQDLDATVPAPPPATAEVLDPTVAPEADSRLEDIAPGDIAPDDLTVAPGDDPTVGPGTRSADGQIDDARDDAAPPDRSAAMTAADRAFAAPLAGLAGELVELGMLDAEVAQRLCETARRTGTTFFRCMADGIASNLATPIYRHICKRRGWALIEAENDVMDLARSQPWLRFARSSELGAVVLAGGEDSTDVAVLDPFDITLRYWLAKDGHLGEKLTSAVVLPATFQSAVQRLKNRSDDDDGEENVLYIDIPAAEEQRISASIELHDVPVLVDYFLQRGYVQSASDIHIEPTEEFLLVRNRVDGILHEDTSLPIDRHPEIVSRIKIISGMDVAEKRRPQDGRIGTSIRRNAIDVRVSSFPTIHGEKLVLRLLDRNALRPSPEDLGMLPRDLRLLYDKLDAPYGLVMICGPTGSGKTTTLYSCLGKIDKDRKNVLTVEDPVEYRLKGVHQMQVNDRIGLTFESGLRTILRQDPDVIMVGECRDHETAAMAIQASLTGHIVFSTIHTNDSIGVITRLLDMGIDSFLVANALTLAIAQRLVRKICDHCRTPKSGDEILARLASEGVTAERLASLGIHVDVDEEYQIGSGCAQCRNTGYQGRQAVFEVFEMTNAARAMIVAADFNADDLRAFSRSQRMTTLIHHGGTMVDSGVTTHEEVIRVLGESY